MESAILNLEGDLLFNQEKYEQALERIQQAIDTCPEEKVEDLNVYKNNMALCYLKLATSCGVDKNFEDAKYFYTKAHLMLIACYLSDKTYEEDLKQVEAAIFNNYGRQLQYQGKYEEALNEFQQALSTCPSDMTEDVNIYKKNSAYCLIWLGKQCSDDKKYENAANFYKKAHEMLINCHESDKSYENDLKHAQALLYNNEGNFLSHEGKFNEAVKKFQLAIEACPSNKIGSITIYRSNLALCFQDLGLKCHSQNEYQKAEEFYKKAHEILTICTESDKKYENDLKHAEAMIHNNDGNRFFYERKFDEAEKKYQQAIEACPSEKVEEVNIYKHNIASCLSCLGMQCKNQNNSEESNNFLKKAHKMLLESYESDKRYEEELKKAKTQQAIETKATDDDISVNNTAECYYELGNQYNNQRKFLEAMEFYDKAYQKCTSEDKEKYLNCRENASKIIVNQRQFGDHIQRRTNLV